MNKQLKSSMAEQPVEGFLPLTPAVFHIPLTLADGEAHGYAIMQEVARRSGGTLRLGPGTLYGAVSRLLQDGVIEESEERPDPGMDDTRRRYYRLTAGGAVQASAALAGARRPKGAALRRLAEGGAA